VSGRTEFLATLRAGLRGAPQSAIDEIVADYSAHFDEGVAANRNEADIAAALGDPHALADELRLELRIETFEAAPSPRSAVQVIAGVIALGFINSMLLCVAAPLLAIAGIALVAAVLAFTGAGIWFLFAGSSLDLPGGAGTTVLGGIGLIAAAVSLSAFLLLAVKALVVGISRYARLRFRFLPRVSQPGKSP
jgi:uncharacterized membrane protein